jgi:hypothetical protein
MKTLIEMTLEYYNRLLAGVVESDREYAILKNGLLTRYGETGEDPRTIVILCQSDEANQIFDLAKRLFPGVTPQIRKYAATD